MRRCALALLAGCVVMLPGCATVPSDPLARAAFKANNDPLEPLNRKLFAVDQVIDRFIIKPAAEVYVKVVPGFGRDAIRNAIRNLKEPVVFGNDVLQGEGRRATITVYRFVLNTTLGVLGIWDFAGSQGLPRQTGDFGQTLHAWGFGEGPYVMLPIWGPSSPRDSVGLGMDLYLDPFRYAEDCPSGFSGAENTAAGIDERSRNLDSLDELRRESIDYYAAFRSLYRQNRRSVVERSTAPPPASDDLYNDPGDAAGPGGATGKQKTS
jgi:phospholipid-binding lipoprotein MlaA